MRMCEILRPDTTLADIKGAPLCIILLFFSRSSRLKLPPQCSSLAGNRFHVRRTLTNSILPFPEVRQAISNIYSIFLPFFSGRSPNDFQFLLPTEISSRVMHRSLGLSIVRIDICCFISFHQFSMFTGSLGNCNLFLSSHSSPRKWPRNDVNGNSGFFGENLTSFVHPRKGVRDTPP